MAVVLVVDDDRDLLPVLAEALTMEGWRVLTAPSASVALKIARSIRVEVVLIDLVMPNQDGQRLESAFKGEPSLKGTPFVFMTAWIRQLDEIPVRVLVKPFMLADAVAMLKSCLPRDELECLSSAGETT